MYNNLSVCNHMPKQLKLNFKTVAEIQHGLVFYGRMYCMLCTEQYNTVFSHIYEGEL